MKTRDDKVKASGILRRDENVTFTIVVRSEERGDSNLQNAAQSL